VTSRVEKQLTMRINDKMLPLDKVYEAQKHLANILHEIDKSVSGRKRSSIAWIVTDARSGSYSVTVEGLASNTQVTDRDIAKNIEDLKNGLSLLRQEAIRPPYFSDTLLKSAKALATLSKPDSSVDLVSEAFGEVSLSRELALNIEKIIGAIYKSYGSVEGILNVIDLREQPIFKITDPITFETIECSFSREDLDTAKEALEKRVYVYGLISSREDGTRVKISVDEIEIFPLEETLPSISEIIGIWAGE
jgi:hypothetical protein